MSVPNEKHTVQRVWNEGGWNPDGEMTDAQKAAFTRAVAWALHTQNPEWGLVSVTPPHTHVQGLSTDLIMWRSTGEIVDVATDTGPVWLTNKTPIDARRWVLPKPEPRPPGPPGPGPGSPEPLVVAMQTLTLVKKIAAHLGIA